SMLCLAKYDALNPGALRKLVAGGANLRYFPKDVMKAAYDKSQELWKELSDSNADFAKIYPSWKTFQEQEASWFRVAESALDNFTFSELGKRG
ncbi:ABC transporter substrate-binding protein, partial [Providencia rettgeri]|nr:ABC transporter substrate-binding protein [Providencia rettgeri]